MADDILNRVKSFFSGEEGLPGDKKVLLGMIRNDLVKNRFSAFYRPRTGDLDGAFADFFYEIYRIIYPAQLLFKTPETPRVLRRVCAESFMDNDAREAARRLSPRWIDEYRKTLEGTALASRLREDLNTLQTSFDSSRRTAADYCFGLIMKIRDFSYFNFFSLLQRFDSHFSEGDFRNRPKFAGLPAEILTEDIEAFIPLVRSLQYGEDWKKALAVLDAVNGGRTLIPVEQWNSLLASLRDLDRSNMLVLLVRHALKDPVWDPKTPVARQEEEDSWFDEIRANTQSIINGIQAALEKSEIERLAGEVFGSAEPQWLRYYNAAEGAVYARRDLGDFDYAGGLSYLAMFIEGYLAKDLQDLSDILIIRGQWINSSSREMSEAIFDLRAMIDDIRTFDETLSEEGTLGSKLKAAFLRLDRETFRANQIRNILWGINSRALELINAAADSLEVMAKYLKNLADDREKKHHELLTNWKELENYSEEPLGRRTAEACRKTALFAQLLRLYSSP
ncbi:MAG: DUF5312 domain-containing protein [Treponema sp.]|jgi:hypothetical protein|nr:DUF5312 domain-containing protein [Treponema sp.]